MDARNRLVTGVHARIQAVTERDASPVLASDAVAEARDLELAAAGDPGAAFVLGWFYWVRHSYFSGIARDAELTKAIAFFLKVYSADPTLVPQQLRELVSATINDPSQLAEVWTGRATAVDLHFRSLSDADSVVQLLRTIIQVTPHDDPSLPRYLVNLGEALLARYQYLNGNPSGVDSSDIEEAVDLGQTAVGLLRPRSSEELRTDSYALHAKGLTALYLHTDRDGDNARAIEAIESMLGVRPGDKALRDWLARAYNWRARRAGQRSDFDAAIQSARQAAQFAAGESATLAWTQVATFLKNRFDDSGDAGDIAEAVRALDRACELASPDDPHWPSFVRAAVGLWDLLNESTYGGELTLNRLIEFGRLAWGMALDQRLHAAEASWVDVGLLLVSALIQRGLSSPDGATSLDEAVTTATLLAQEARTAGNLDPRGRCETLLLAALSGRAASTRLPQHADEAVDVARRVLGEFPAEHDYHYDHMCSLGSALLVRSQVAGDLRDAIESVAATEMAATRSVPDHPRRNRLLTTLAESLLFGMDAWPGGVSTGGPSAALDVCQEIIARESSVSPANLALLARAYLAAGTGGVDHVPELIDQAIAAAQEAIQRVPVEASLRQELLRTLGSANFARFVARGERADLEQAISQLQAVATTKTGTNGLLTLGEALRERYSASRQPGDAAAAGDAFAAVLNAPLSPLPSRIRAAMNWGELAAASGNWQEAKAMWFRAIALLAEAAELPSSIMTAVMTLARHGSAGGLAASAALNCDEPIHAVRALEESRGIIADYIERSRLALRLVKQMSKDEVAANPALLQTMSVSGDFDGFWQHLMDYHRVSDEFDGNWRHLMAQVRELQPGLQLAPITEVLIGEAYSGAVIYLNVTSYRADAVILRGPGKVDVVPLPGVTLDAAVTHARALGEAANDGALLNTRLADALTWMWDSMAAPVFECLGIVGAPREGQPWPRLWWIAAGPLAMLPLHAAGYHDGSGRTVLDRAISSYVPTLRSLHARRNTPVTNGQPLVVGVGHAPGYAALNKAVNEAELVASRLADARVLVDEAASATAVMQALPGANYAHFACHAVTEMNPFDSRLVIADGPITVRDISTLDVAPGRLAYLSACQTAAGAGRFSSESLHIAGTLHMAGYTHVIATLWPISDSVALKFANYIYSGALPHFSPGLSVHEAVRQLRAEYPSLPFLWASHVHIGP